MLRVDAPVGDAPKRLARGGGGGHADTGRRGAEGCGGTRLPRFSPDLDKTAALQPADTAPPETAEGRGAETAVNPVAANSAAEAGARRTRQRKPRRRLRRRPHPPSPACCRDQDRQHRAACDGGGGGAGHGPGPRGQRGGSRRKFGRSPKQRPSHRARCSAPAPASFSTKIATLEACRSISPGRRARKRKSEKDQETAKNRRQWRPVRRIARRTAAGSPSPPRRSGSRPRSNSSPPPPPPSSAVARRGSPAKVQSAEAGPVAIGAPLGKPYPAHEPSYNPVPRTPSR